MDSSPQQTNDGKKAPTIRDLFPDLTDDQAKEAEENLERYLEVALRIYERIITDPEAYRQLKALTVSKPNRTMNKRSS